MPHALILAKMSQKDAVFPRFPLFFSFTFSVFPSFSFSCACVPCFSLLCSLFRPVFRFCVSCFSLLVPIVFLHFLAQVVDDVAKAAAIAALTGRQWQSDAVHSASANYWTYDEMIEVSSRL